MQLSSLYLLIVILIVNVSGLAGCSPAQRQSELFKQSAYIPLELKGGKQSREIALQRIKIEVPDHKIVGEVSVGVGHFKRGELILTGMTNDSSIYTLHKIFYDGLLKMKYNVQSVVNNIFDKDSVYAELEVGARMVDIKSDINIQYEPFVGHVGSSTAYMVVEWQVYSRLDKKIVYTKQISGSGRAAIRDVDPQQASNGQAGNEAMFFAFSDAVQGLMADTEFYQLASRPQNLALPSE